MSETKGKIFSVKFKAKAALEATRGIKSVNQIAQDFGVHPAQVGLWTAGDIQYRSGLSVHQ